MRSIIIVGAGGFGREMAWTLERINAREETWNILGFADDDPEKAKGMMEGYALLGKPADALAAHPDAAVAIAIGDNATREKVYRQLRGRDFPTIVDPSADVAPTAELRHGTFVGPQAVVSVGCELGKFVIVNARAGVGHDTKAGDFSQMCPGASLSGHCEVGEYGYIGTNACAVPGVKIGARAKVAAGTPAYRDLGEGETLSPFGILKGEK